MPGAFIRSLTSIYRSERTDVQLGLMLAFIAGALNAGGFIAVGVYTSHMSGIASSIGDFFAMHQWYSAFSAGLFLCSFLFGAITCSIIINAARARKLASEYALPLLVEALLLLTFGAAMIEGLPFFSSNTLLIVSLLCFIMGLQNAIITKISKSVIRTTHVTGITTDIGIEIGRYISQYTGINQEVEFRSKRLKILCGLLGAFILGGIVGAISFKTIGFITTVPLAFVLGVFALVPILDDVRMKYQA